MRGRKKRPHERERTTTFGLRLSLEHAILELQQKRLLSIGKRPTMKDVIIEALESLLHREGITPVEVVERIPASEASVVPMPIRQ